MEYKGWIYPVKPNGLSDVEYVQWMRHFNPGIPENKIFGE